MATSPYTVSGRPQTLPSGVHHTRLKWLNGCEARLYSHTSSSSFPPRSSSSSSPPFAPASTNITTPVAKDSGVPRCVVYWMQRSVRSSFNHALEVAIHYANQLDVPLLVVYAIVTSYPGANERGFAFLFEGLHETQTSLANRGIRLVVREAKVVGENITGGAAATAVPLTIVDTCKRVKAPLLVMDRAYERLLRTWREDVCARVACPVLMVESDVVVPVDVVSPQPLSSAAALRRAHAPLLPQYLLPLPEGSLLHPSHALPTFSASAPSPLFPDELEMHDPLALLSSLADLDRSVPRVIFKRGGSTQAKLLLARFLRDRLRGYQAHRKEAAARHQSFLSPYLHFGHISPIYVALKVRQHSSSTPQDRRRFCDELLTWREMAVHFVYHHRESYDRYEGIPRWARESLEEAADQAEGGRRHAYSLTELEEGRTHDLLWNAAQEEMRVTGYMNNYMRMFWCKSIIAWTAEGPREAYRRSVLLNDKYFLDGRDCNGYMGVAWCFGLYDRPMPGFSPIFGKVRRMTANGVRAKQDVGAYICQVKDLAAKVDRASRWGREGGGKGLSGDENTGEHRNGAILGVEDAIYAKPLSHRVEAFLSPVPKRHDAKRKTDGNSESDASYSAGRGLQGKREGEVDGERGGQRKKETKTGASSTNASVYNASGKKRDIPQNSGKTEDCEKKAKITDFFAGGRRKEK